MTHVRKNCITFMMTNQCDLSCLYCYLGHHDMPEQSIDLQFARQGLRDFFEQSPSRHIRFFASGEPTREIEKVKSICYYARELAGAELTCEIQTSGIFSTEIAHWLAENIDITWVSCDGPPDIQDRLRPTCTGHKSSPTVERNIAILLAGKNGHVVGARSTVTDLNVDRQVEMIEYFHDLGLYAVFSDPVFAAVSTDGSEPSQTEIGKDFMMKYAREFLRARERAQELGVFYGSILSVNFDEQTEYFCRSCLPAPHLTTDGCITCCDMASDGDSLPELVYGRFDVATGRIVYDDERIAAIRMRKVCNLVECQGCEVAYHCAGACLGEGLNETGQLLGVKTDYCEAIRFLAKHLPVDAGLYPYLHP